MRVILVIVSILLIWTLYKHLKHKEIPETCTVILEIEGQGLVKGNYETTQWTNQDIMQFRGIPYAVSPKGLLRFKAPVPYKPWKGIIDVTKPARSCPGLSMISKLSKKSLKHDLENCLNLCVYTKSIEGSFPVMFYIYGGGFNNGSSSDYPPKYLLEKDIVLVVPNYRIGALGWLTTLSEDMPGNASLMDLLMALQWVQSHIHNFGGDPTRVTIFAQSAGASLAGALLLSPKTPSQFFGKVIMQSGSVLAGWSTNKEPLEQARRICKRIKGCNCRTKDDLNYCFRKISIYCLLEKSSKEFFPSVVGDLNGILPSQPNELILIYNKSIPIMTGFTKHDGTFVLAAYYDALKEQMGKRWKSLTVRQFAEGLINNPIYTHDPTRITNNLVLHQYFSKDLLESINHKEAIPAYIDIAGLYVIKSPVIGLATLLFRTQSARIYLYSFEYAGKNTRFGYEMKNSHYPFYGGIHHSDENIYLFSTHDLEQNDAEMSIIMVELWTSFAADGSPSINSDNLTILPMQTETGPYLRINKKIDIKEDVLQEITAAIDDSESKKLIRSNVKF